MEILAITTCGHLLFKKLWKCVNKLSETPIVFNTSNLHPKPDQKSFWQSKNSERVSKEESYQEICKIRAL